MKHLKLFSATALLLSLAIPTLAADNNASAAFERLKKLAGTWEATTPDGKSERVVYEVIANGTAVIERDAHEGGTMETVYHLDGDKLGCHFCESGILGVLPADVREHQFLVGVFVIDDEQSVL